MWKNSSKRFEEPIDNLQRNDSGFNIIKYPLKLQISKHTFDKSKTKLQQSKHISRESQQKSIHSNRDIGQVIKVGLKNGQQIPEPYKNYITNISCVPIVSKASENTFVETDYPLEEEEKVSVCRQYIFSTKNYFNYLYEMQNQKSAQIIRQKFDRFLKPSLQHTLKISQFKKQQYKQQQIQKQIQQSHKDKVPRFQNNVLESKHTAFKDQHRRKTFWIKEIDRKFIEQQEQGRIPKKKIGLNINHQERA